MLTEHTPTPWSLDSIPGEIRAHDLRLLHVYCPAGSGDIQQANAAYIVRCVNSHEALVEALRSLAIELYAGANTLYREKAILKCDQDWLLDQAAKAKAALAQADEKGAPCPPTAP